MTNADSISVFGSPPSAFRFPLDFFVDRGLGNVVETTRVGELIDLIG
jgi:hypothetical protein